MNASGTRPVRAMRHHTRNAIHVQLLRYGMGIATMLLSVGAPLAAQTLFQWPSIPIDVTKYKTPEQCLSFILRLHNSLVFTNDGADRDTLALALPEVQALPDSSIIQAAARCAVNYTPETAAPHDLTPLMQLYLLAGHDADAQVLATRVLASSATEDEAARLDILLEIVRQYLTARPARLAAVLPFLGMITEGPVDVGLRQRLGILHMFLGAARRAQDTVRIQYAANTLLQLARRSENPIQGAPENGYVLAALEALATDTLLNSLRQSTAGYVAMHQKLQKQASATRAIGEIAPPLEGDYWFAAGANGASRLTAPPVRPARGKVSVIVFLDPWVPLNITPPNYDAIGRDARGSLATVRRLLSQYPELDVTAVAGTHGVFQRTEPPAPDAEADTLRSYWLDFWKMPGVLSIQRTPFARLPDPDRRVIEHNIPNIENYNFGVRSGATRMWTFIVDRDGTIVWYGKMDRETEAEMNQIIGILMQRNI